MAVFGLGCGGCAWYLVLLALVPMAVSPSGAHPLSSEFYTLFSRLKILFESCPLNCNSTLLDKKCHCLNVSESCVFPGYLISGLRAVNHMLPERSRHIGILINKLEFSGLHLSRVKVSVNLSCDSSAPRAFFSSMDNAVQYINAIRTQIHK